MSNGNYLSKKAFQLHSSRCHNFRENEMSFFFRGVMYCTCRVASQALGTGQIVHELCGPFAREDLHDRMICTIRFVFIHH